MRFLANCFALCTVVLLLSNAAKAESKQVKLRASKAALPAAKFDPKLSVAENNRRLNARDPNSFLLASYTLPADQIDLTSTIGTAVRFQTKSGEFEGEITTFQKTGAASAHSEILLFVRVKNRKREGNWLLKAGVVGAISFVNSANARY